MKRPDGARVADVAERQRRREADNEAPAPPDADVCGPVVVCQFDEQACDHRRAGDTPPVLTLQPWTPRGAAATYVAWDVDDCGGHFGVFDADTERLLLGEGTPAGRRWHPVVETGPASDVLAASTPALRPSVPRATATATVDTSPALDPKPGDAAEYGETQTYTLSSWTRPVTASVQPWRPLNGGAVYLACRIDDTQDRFSYHGWFGTLDDGVLRLGRRPAPAFVAIDIEEVDALRAEVRALVPERTSARVVGAVLDVRDGRA